MLLKKHLYRILVLIVMTLTSGVCSVAYATDSVEHKIDKEIDEILSNDAKLRELHVLLLQLANNNNDKDKINSERTNFIRNLHSFALTCVRATPLIAVAVRTSLFFGSVNQR